MVGEDLTPFFNTAENAVAATIKAPGGALVRTTKVIFTDPIQEMQFSQESADHTQPNFLCPTADLAGVAKGFTAEIAGRGTFRIVRHTSDGTGVSTAYLARV